MASSLLCSPLSTSLAGPGFSSARPLSRRPSPAVPAKLNRLHSQFSGRNTRPATHGAVEGTFRAKGAAGAVQGFLQLGVGPIRFRRMRGRSCPPLVDPTLGVVMPPLDLFFDRRTLSRLGWDDECHRRTRREWGEARERMREEMMERMGKEWRDEWKSWGEEDWRRWEREEGGRGRRRSRWFGEEGGEGCGGEAGTRGQGKCKAEDRAGRAEATASATASHTHEEDRESEAGGPAWEAPKYPQTDTPMVQLTNEENGAEVTVVGTAHISSSSVEDVRDAIRRIRPDYVMIELDRDRFQRLTTSDERVGAAAFVDQMMRGLRGMSEGKAGNMIGFGLMGLYRLLAARGHFPGEEFRAAVEEARKIGATVVLGDQPVSETLHRLDEVGISFRDVVAFFSQPMPPDVAEALGEAMGSGASTGGPNGGLSARVEKLKERKLVRRLNEVMARFFPSLYRVVMTERNTKMVTGLRKIKGSVVAVVGMSHVDEIEQMWQEANDRFLRPRREKKAEPEEPPVRVIDFSELDDDSGVGDGADKAEGVSQGIVVDKPDSVPPLASKAEGRGEGGQQVKEEDKEKVGEEGQGEVKGEEEQEAEGKVTKGEGKDELVDEEKSETSKKGERTSDKGEAKEGRGDDDAEPSRL